MLLRRPALLAPLMIAAACDVGAGGEVSFDAAAEESGKTFAHAFPAIDIGAGEETQVCASWTLENTDKLFFNRVSMTAGPGFHHSNWFFVPETKYEGPDGIWPCEERKLDDVGVATAGGVLFAQSTQSRAEEQVFREGAAVQMPIRTRIVGQIHLLNASTVDVSTAIELTVDTVPRDEVTTRLQPMMMMYRDLNIPPNQRSEFSTTCNVAEQFGDEPVDFSFHYVLPHYHDLGESAGIEIVGGPHDGTSVWQLEAPIGEPWGTSLEPPVSAADSAGLRFHCRYNNTRDEFVHFGYGDQEMCIILAFTDSAFRWAGIVSADEEVGLQDGISLHEGECVLFALPPWT